MSQKGRLLCRDGAQDLGRVRETSVGVGRGGLRRLGEVAGINAVPASVCLSIVICTRNRADLLQFCLQSLIEELHDAQGYEVIVVDNASMDHTNQVLEEFAGMISILRSVYEQRTGLSHARNRGWREARGEWVIYLDDDARVLPGWWVRAVYLAESNQFEMVGGVYLPWYKDGRRGWFRDNYASNKDTASRFGPLPEDRYVAGGNMMIRRDLLVEFNGFDPSLGMRASYVGYGEETLLQNKIRCRGKVIGFDPLWVIEHLVGLDKQRVGWLLRSSYAVGRDSWAAFGTESGLLPLLGLVRRMVTRPLLSAYRELTSQQETTAQSLLLSFARPLALTVGAIAAGVRLQWAGRLR